MLTDNADELAMHELAKTKGAREEDSQDSIVLGTANDVLRMTAFGILLSKSGLTGSHPMSVILSLPHFRGL
jgi:hypothetical protein